MRRSRSRTPVAGRSRCGDDTESRADPKARPNVTQQVDPYDSRSIQPSLTNTKVPVSKTIVRTKKTPSGGLQHRTIPARGQSAGLTAQASHRNDHHTRTFPTQGDSPNASESSSRIDSGRRPTSNGAPTRRMSRERDHTSNDQRVRRSSFTTSRRRRNSSNDTHSRRSSKERGRRPESTQRGHDSDREESRRRSSSSRMRKDRQRKEEDRGFSTMKLSQEYVTMIYTKEEPRVEIRSERIARGEYGGKGVIYFLFKVTVLDAEKIKDNLEIRFQFLNDPGSERITVLMASPREIRTPVISVDRTKNRGRESGVTTGTEQLTLNHKEQRGDTKAWNQSTFWELKIQERTHEVEASLKRHGSEAPLIPVPFNMQFLISDCGQTPFYIACDVDWKRNNSLLSDDGRTSKWREVDMTDRDDEELDFKDWKRNHWERIGDPVGFDKESGHWCRARSSE